MSFDLTLGFDPPDPNSCPLTFEDLIALLNALIHGELVGDFLPYVTGAATPSVDDQDKVWMRQDANGRPIGTFQFYAGNWRKQYSAPVGSISLYSGDPAVDFSGSGGAGTMGSAWDGWQLCNGNNGAPNLSDKFVVGAKMDDLAVGYPNGDGPWSTSVTGVTTQEGAGVHEITLDATNTFRKPIAEIKLAHWDADNSHRDAGAGLIGAAGSPEFNFTLVEADAGLDPAPAIPTLPPYYATAYVIFQGYV